jgi:hypothetical protein
MCANIMSCTTGLRQRWLHALRLRRRDGAKKTRKKHVSLLRQFILKLIDLPRHARDKHRESTQKKEMRFSQGFASYDIPFTMLDEVRRRRKRLCLVLL